jgi:hypothetical protein
MKLQPYIQSSIMPRANQKLSFKFFGPFPVVEKIGKVASRLKLPENSSVHPVVHVSQGAVSAQLPSSHSQDRVPGLSHGDTRCESSCSSLSQLDRVA